MKKLMYESKKWVEGYEKEKISFEHGVGVDKKENGVGERKKTCWSKIERTKTKTQNKFTHDSLTNFYKVTQVSVHGRRFWRAATDCGGKVNTISPKISLPASGLLPASGHRLEEEALVRQSVESRRCFGKTPCTILS